MKRFSCLLNFLEIFANEIYFFQIQRKWRFDFYNMSFSVSLKDTIYESKRAWDKILILCPKNKRVVWCLKAIIDGICSMFIRFGRGYFSLHSSYLVISFDLNRFNRVTNCNFLGSAINCLLTKIEQNMVFDVWTKHK